jgi:hypothetical protein
MSRGTRRNSITVQTFICQLLLLICILVFLGGCRNEQESLVIVSKSLMKRVETSSAVPLEFGGFAPANSNIYWIEGRVKNASGVDAKNVELGFKCALGVETRVLYAKIDRVPAGKTVPFKTEVYQSRIDLQLPADGQPEIRYE